MAHIIPVILCGGSGTRLWPMSRESFPKQFLNLVGDYSLLQNTVRRALAITKAPSSNLVIVTLDTFKQDVKAQLQSILPPDFHMLGEPSARNTAAAVAYAAAYIEETFGSDAIMWVLPADHHIGDEAALGQSFEKAKAAAEQDYLVTFGIHPTRPDTGYGYIQLGKTELLPSVTAVEAFYEKPDLETAKQYLAAGDFLWNSGMFVFRAGAVLSEFDIHAPGIASAARTALSSGDKTAPSQQTYDAIPKEPFDKAIMEKSSRVMVVPSDPKWSDIGSWESLWEIDEKDTHNNVIKGEVTAHELDGCYVQSYGNRMVACAGLKNLVIVDTGDAVLVADRSNAEAVKSLVIKLKEAGRTDILKDLANLG